MKKILLSLLLAFSVFVVNETVIALANSDDEAKSTGSKDTDDKDKNVADLSKTISRLNDTLSGFNDVHKQISLINSSVREFIDENYLSDENFSSLLAFTIFTRNASDLFSWLHKITSALKNDFDNLQKASDEKNELDSKKTSEDINRKIDALLGNGILSLRANTKASAYIFLEMIKTIEYSAVDIDNFKKHMDELKTKGEETSETMKVFTSALRKIKEIDRNKVSKLTTDIDLILEILMQINNCFSEEKMPANIIADLQETCSHTQDSHDSTSSKFKKKKKKKEKRNNDDEE